jgi:hypothetical protein
MCIRGPAKSQMTFDLQAIYQFSEFSRIECSDIDNSVDLSRKLISRLHDPKGKSKRCHIDLNKLRVKLATVKDSQSSVQDKFCSKQTQPLLQTDVPLHVHTRSCKKSDDI